jgi:hypothetical protein
VSITFDQVEELGTGRFRVRSRALARVTPGEEVTDTAVRRARVLLEVNGMRHPLEPPGIVIGRGSDADLRINDPGVSRRHTEIRISPGTGGEPSVAVVDLGSTNGMQVDGRRVDHATARDGTVVQIGNTELTIRIVPDREEGAGV